MEFNDSKRNHDIDSTTPEEKTEIALFHSFKQDPFYKHHLRNFLSQFAEQVNNNILIQFFRLLLYAGKLSKMTQ